jgi:hypothetical protein
VTSICNWEVATRGLRLKILCTSRSCHKLAIHSRQRSILCPKPPACSAPCHCQSHPFIRRALTRLAAIQSSFEVPPTVVLGTLADLTTPATPGPNFRSLVYRWWTGACRNSPWIMSRCYPSHDDLQSLSSPVRRPEPITVAS